jgi:hypothetical protein
VVSFEGKVKMTGAAFVAAAMENATLISEWAKVSRSLRRKGILRNEIAHGTLVTFHNTEPPTTWHVPYYWSESLKHFGGGPPPNAMKIDQLKSAVCAFKAGIERIRRASAPMQATLEARRQRLGK